jgi:hypothetical protein
LVHLRYLLTLPPYILDLSSSDFYLFTHLKQFVGGTRMRTGEEVKKMVKDWFSGLRCRISAMQTYTETRHSIQVPESSRGFCRRLV